MLNTVFDPFPELSTERLLLREVTPNDAAELFAFRSDPWVMRYIDRPRMTHIGEAEQMIASYRDLKEKGSAVTWGITLHGSAKIVGVTSIWHIQHEHYRAEVGYLLGRDHSGKGIMSETLTATLHYGFKIMGLHSMEALVNPGNKASIGVLEKKGFIREAYYKENYFFDNEFKDTGVYSLISPYPFQPSAPISY